MINPPFFNDVPVMTLKDPLAEILGASLDGNLTYSYADVVKLAGHSCPTVAGAYLMVFKGLNALYGDEIPVRGEIKVYIKGVLGDGVVGVIANVASMITGATDIGGFHGLGGKYDRRALLFYDADLPGDMVLERTDNAQKVVLTYDPFVVPNDPRISQWMKEILSGEANKETRESFRLGWQERVKNILFDYREDSRLIQCVRKPL